MSTQVDEQVATMSLAMLDFQMDESLECEHFQHEMGVDHHAGDGEWYMKFACPKCGDPDFGLYCTPWKAYMLGENMVRCAVCSKNSRTKDYLKGVWKRSEYTG